MSIARSPVGWLTLLVLAFVALLAFSVAPAAAAAPNVVGPENGTAFLCPAVGGPNAGGPLVGGQNTFLPGHNQAGAHANAKSNNTQGPGQSPGPGNGNSEWSPIWPAPTAG